MDIEQALNIYKQYFIMNGDNNLDKLLKYIESCLNKNDYIEFLRKVAVYHLLENKNNIVRNCY
jgi:hypothetical protein